MSTAVIDHGQVCGMAGCVAWPGVWHGPVCGMARCVAWPGVRHGQVCGMAQCAAWPGVWHGLVCGMAKQLGWYSGKQCAMSGSRRGHGGKRSPPAIAVLSHSPNVSCWTHRS